MTGGTLSLALGGLILFAVGAYLSATGALSQGIVFMAAALALQILSLVRLRQARNKIVNKDDGDARG
ncbi:hypothetical protein J3454_01540 [Erythrobacter sp. NFXS35]|uniref:hypothetical protein n=1 Tax=Erythrobacter sp. NFXS35 TaxID=2818436 RepID=UPI0032DF0ED4